MKEYQAPQLTRYGKATDFIQAGSVLIAAGDITGDGEVEQAFDTDLDGKADVVIGGANGGTTNVSFQFDAASDDGVISESLEVNSPLGGENFDFYDSDGDGNPDFAISENTFAFGDNTNSPILQNINEVLTYYVTFSYSGKFKAEPSLTDNIEESSIGGWNDPARD